MRGYTQIRYNRLLETNPNLKCEQCDKSWGNGSLFIRRLRLILSGDISENVYIYIQPDFASSNSESSNLGQIRDAYFDLALDEKKESRLRIGQSKVPFGFENLQSSQNRLSLDRSDGLNSAVANERDVGIFYYFAPSEIRKRFAYLVSSGLKGSGDYGVFGLGVYNGQTANQEDLNNKMHVAARLTYPFELANKQIIEPGIQAYTGEYVVSKSKIKNSAQTEELKTSEANGLPFRDQRIAASFVLYPQPIGIQAEYNIGNGPEYNPNTNLIEKGSIKGGYILINYMTKIQHDVLIPFIRYHSYDGGKKHENDARRHKVREVEFGLEWQPKKDFELVAMYTKSRRRFEDSTQPNNFQRGSLLRLQAQINF